MKKIVLMIVLMFAVTGIASAQGGYDEFYDKVFGNGDQAYVDYSAVVPSKAADVRAPYPRCLFVFAGVRDGQNFLYPSENTVTVYAGQHLYITPMLNAKGQVTVTAGEDFNRLFTEDSVTPERADKSYTAQKSGHAVVQLGYAGMTCKVEINVITWRNFSLVNDQLRLAAFVGDVFFFRLPCNAKSGYDWYPAANWNKDMFKIVDTGYTKTSNPNSNTEHYWLVKALMAGQGEIRFEYHRDKKNDYNLQDCSIKVTVEGY